MVVIAVAVVMRPVTPPMDAHAFASTALLETSVSLSSALTNKIVAIMAMPRGLAPIAHAHVIQVGLVLCVRYSHAQMSEIAVGRAKLLESIKLASVLAKRVSLDSPVSSRSVPMKIAMSMARLLATSLIASATVNQDGWESFVEQ